MTEFIVNKISQSELITINPEDFYPKGERIVLDLKDLLFQGLIIREKDLRDFVKSHDWTQYLGKNVSITCSVDVIIPYWSYMLIMVYLQPYANMAIAGDMETLEKHLFQAALSNFKPEEYSGKKIVIKGCGEKSVPLFVYTELTRLLRPYVASLMYGEPCSTVPLFKKKTE